MSVQIRFRTDGCHFVQMRAKGTEWRDIWGISKEEWDALEPGRPGDIWRIRWYKDGSEGPIAGYAIWCPKCNDLHHWTTATNCREGGQEHSYKSGTGVERTYYVCGHSGVGSCWEWTGSAEEGTLTARPSLLCHTCGFHGWLTNGQLSDC
jgi:hypothetical protein